MPSGASFLTRMSSDPRTRAYVERRSAQGLSRREIMRVLKRYVAREVYRHLPGVSRPRSRWTSLTPEMPDADGCLDNDLSARHLTLLRDIAWPNNSLPSHEWPITGLPAPSRN